ncbi:MAG: hypothetical protein H6Q90_713 [Deltaproteobacteria bacterium]|nr:hypothetical protein [Deltaproteobacteria bacterium]
MSDKTHEIARTVINATNRWELIAVFQEATNTLDFRIENMRTRTAHPVTERAAGILLGMREKDVPR